MKKLVYKGNATFYYTTDLPSFSLVHHYKDGSIGTTNGWTTCRETLINYIHNFAFQKTKSKRIRRIRFEVLICLTTNKGSAIAKQKVAHEKYVRRSERIINHFESRVGWPLTKIRRVEVPRGNMDVYMLSASPRWMRNSFLVSTYLLMFRAGRSPHVDEWKTHKELLQKLESFPLGADGNSIRKTSDKWEILLKYRDELNGNRTVKQNFDPREVTNVHTYAIGIEGISRLCAGTTADWLYLNRFAKVCKKEGKHITVPAKKKMANI